MDWPTEIGTFCFLHRNLNGSNQTLYIERGGGEVKDMHHGFHVPPGGHFKRGERGIDCVIREFREETGLIIKNPKLRQIVMFYNKDRILGGKTDRPDWYVEVYEANEFEGKLKAERKKDKLVWIDDSQMQNLNVYECDRRIIKLLTEEGVYNVLVKYDGIDLETFDSVRIA
jgi:8-oxo-dGTP diphosphatase